MITGKNKRHQIKVYDSIHQQTLEVDSIEEQDFLNWLCEATNLKIILDFQYQPKTYILSESIKYINVFGKENTLFQEHKYTPDFKITLCPTINLELSKEFHIFKDQLSNKEVSVLIDVKGMFAKNDGGRSFSINQKWMYQRYKLYVYKLVPKKFFSKFGCPKASFYTAKTKKARKNFVGCKSIEQVFQVQSVH